LTAAASNPRVASCSMVSVLPAEERLKVPGQSKWLVWLGGDFSVLGQSFGIEYWDAGTDTYRRVYSYIAHPQGVLDQLRSALAGNSKKGMAVVSTILERANVLMAGFMLRQPRSSHADLKACSERLFHAAKRGSIPHFTCTERTHC
jgi:hypothetical protein